MSDFVTEDKCAVLYLSSRGEATAKLIASRLPDCQVIVKNDKITALIHQVWSKYSRIICVMASGIAVRAIAPLCNDKYNDPCVVVVDEARKFAVSLLSGHIGGGNGLATRVAEILDGIPVITTASDVTDHTAVDLWCRDNHLVWNSKEGLTAAAATLVEKGQLKIFIDLAFSGELPVDFIQVDDYREADMCLGYSQRRDFLTCSPKNMYVGIGCNRGTSEQEIASCFEEFLATNSIQPEWIAGLATIDLKIDEVGLLQFSRKTGLGLQYFNKDQLNAVDGVESSPYVLKAIGAKGVAEPAAMLAAACSSGVGKLYTKKTKWPNVTMAVALRTLLLKI